MLIVRSHKLRYQYLNTKIQNSKREYDRAALGFFNLANEKDQGAEDAQEMIGLSIKCAIIMNAGVQKDRLLALLMKDERAKQDPHYDLLVKWATGSVVKPEQTKAFA